MLGDLKSFFTKSSVGEVTVGLTIGAAFTNLLTEATEAGRGLLGGEFESAGLVQALIALVAAALFSLFLVVKPLARLKAAADRSQVELVARSAPDETSVTAPLAEEGVDDGLVADTTADPTFGSPAADEEALVAVDAGPTPDAVTADEVLPVVITAPEPAPAYAWHTTSAGDRLERLPAEEEVIDLDALASEAPVETETETTEPAAPVEAASTVVRAGAPHSHSVTKVCPYCAFDIPAVASRCGYCTADLTDAQRVAGVVLVDQMA